MPTYMCPDCLKKCANRAAWIKHMRRCTAPKAR
jgi:hypothetical protein